MARYIFSNGIVQPASEAALYPGRRARKKRRRPPGPTILFITVTPEEVGRRAWPAAEKEQRHEQRG
jgi:hypothetical protein